MLIILEGVDGAGKSTLADALITEHKSRHGSYRAKVLHRGPLDKDRDPLDEYENSLEYSAADFASLTVCDRWYLSEMIYGPLYRGRSRLDEFRWVHVNKFLEARGALKIVVTAKASTIIERLDSRGEDYLKPEHIKLVHHKYHQFGPATGWMMVNSDWPIDVKGILRTAKALEAKVRGIAHLKTYVGPPNPEVLLVSNEPGRPAFQPYDGAPAINLQIVKKHRHPMVGMIDQSEVNGHSLKALGHPVTVSSEGIKI